MPARTEVAAVAATVMHQATVDQEAVMAVYMEPPTLQGKNQLYIV